MAIPLIGAIASLGSAAIGGLASYFGNQAQAGAIKYAANLQNQQYNKTLDMLQPAITAGNTARDYQLGALGLPGGNSDAISAFRQSPGYQSGLKTGLNSAQTSAAAGGRLFSGGTLKSLQRYGANYADQGFGDWYNRLGGISGSGQTATTNAINAGTSATNNLSDLAVQSGNNQASSYVAGANALTGGIQNLADLYAYYTTPKATTAPQNYVWGGYN